MKLNNIEHIFFDLDHTLWDFDKNSALAFAQVFEKQKIAVEVGFFLQTYLPINLNYWELYREDKVTKEVLRYGRLKDSFNALKIDVEDNIIETLAEDYIQFLPNHNHLLEGSEEILDYLHPQYKLHIITNGFEEVQHKKLANCGISKYFTTITTSEEVGVKKPHRDIFLKALKKSNATAQNSIMIGDNLEADIRGATNCGFQSIYFDYYQKDEELECLQVKKLKDLLNYL